MIFWRSLVLIFVGVCFSQAKADFESTMVLPKGVFSPQFMYGSYSGLHEKFGSDGQVEGVTDNYKINLSGKNLALFSTELRKLVDALNSYNESERIGDQLSLGTIEFRSKPSLNYFAPSLSYGITERLSLGFGVPIIKFRNEMQIVQSGSSNLQAISQHTRGVVHDVDAGLKQLSNAVSNLPGTLQDVLAAKGYKPIRTVEYTAPGDFIVSALYKYYSGEKLGLAVRPFVQLPTGRKDDPDDLVDSATGGQPAAGVYSIHDYELFKSFTLSNSLGYKFHPKDDVEMRVPSGPEDILPGPESKETLKRKTGDVVMAEGGFRFQVLKPVELASYYVYSQKGRDKFEGGKDLNYSVLGENTQSEIHEIKARVEFNTVGWYLDKSFAVPFYIGYLYGNTVRAINAPNIISNVVYLRMFF